MKLKNNFDATLIGVMKETKKRKTDGTMYDFVTVAIVQDGACGNLRMMQDLFKSVQEMDFYKEYHFSAEFNSDYKEYVVTGISQKFKMPGDLKR